MCSTCLFPWFGSLRWVDPYVVYKTVESFSTGHGPILYLPAPTSASTGSFSSSVSSGDVSVPMSHSFSSPVALLESLLCQLGWWNFVRIPTVLFCRNTPMAAAISTAKLLGVLSCALKLQCFGCRGSSTLVYCDAYGPIYLLWPDQNPAIHCAPVGCWLVLILIISHQLANSDLVAQCFTRFSVDQFKSFSVSS